MKFLLACAAVAVAGCVAPASSVAEHMVSPASEQGQKGRLVGRSTDAEELAEGGELTAPLRRLAETPAVCTMGSPDTAAAAVATIDEYTLKAEFTCGPETAESYLKPELPSNAQKCFETSSCTGNSYKTVDGAVSFGQKKFTLALNSMPPRTDELFYKCENAGKTCVLTVKMPTEPGTNVCTLSKTIQLELTGVKSSVDFFCKSTAAKGVKLLPEPATVRVYQGFDCGVEKELKELLPDAELTGSSQTKYTLSVKTLPRERLELCYKCNYQNAEAAEKPCLVKVSVKAAATTTTTQTTSSASLAGRLSHFLAGLALTAGALGAY